MPTAPLITTATVNNDLNNSASTTVSGVAVGATAFIYNTGMDTGNDTLNMNKNDSLLTTAKIFDSDNDGIITFNAKTDTLSSDRTGAFTFAGDDTIKFTSIDGASGLRYLGTRDSYFVYADAKVRTTLATTGLIVKEGTVNDDSLAGTAAADAFLYDTALGLDLGHDSISGFSAVDRIVTTTKIFDSNNDGKITLGNNGINLPGDIGSEPVSLNPEMGGLVSLTDLAGKQIKALYLIEDQVIDGVHYYFYGSTPTV